MKNLFLLFAVLVMIGCDQASVSFLTESEDISLTSYRPDPIVDIVDMTMEEYGLDNQGSILRWVSDNIEYERDYENWVVPEYWQTPEQTLTKRTGDCEDYCILAQEMLRRIGVESEIVVVYTENDNLHAVLQLYIMVREEYKKIESQQGYYDPVSGGYSFSLFDTYITRINI